VAVGRYRQGGTFDVALSGTVNDQALTFRFPGQVFSQDTRGATGGVDSLPRLWATRKIGYLLNQVRLKGADQETIDQIVKLSVRYGIVTPYTSYLVTETNLLGAQNQQKVAQDALRAAQAPQAASGQGAVEKSAGQSALSQAQQAPALSEEASQSVVALGARTFVLTNGMWTDTAYDANQQQTRKVEFLSEDYFKLGESRADVAAALALGSRVIVLVDGTAYEVNSMNAPQVTSMVAQATQAPAVRTATPTPARVSATPRPKHTATFDPTYPPVQRPAPKIQEWLPLAAIGLGVLVSIVVALLAVLKKK
jgi:Ca-activated chloride channel homolog